VGRADGARPEGQAGAVPAVRGAERWRSRLPPWEAAVGSLRGVVTGQRAGEPRLGAAPVPLPGWAARPRSEPPPTSAVRPLLPPLRSPRRLPAALALPGDQRGPRGWGQPRVGRGCPGGSGWRGWLLSRSVPAPEALGGAGGRGARRVPGSLRE